MYLSIYMYVNNTAIFVIYNASLYSISHFKEEKFRCQNNLRTILCEIQLIHLDYLTISIKITFNI